MPSGSKTANECSKSSGSCRQPTSHHEETLQSKKSGKVAVELSKQSLDSYLLPVDGASELIFDPLSKPLNYSSMQVGEKDNILI